MDTEDTKPNRLSKRMRVILAGATLIAVGGAAGAVAVDATRPSVEMAPLAPVAIRSLSDSDAIVTVKGRTAEIFGNKFILADASGRALVDTGRAGDDRALVAVGQPVTVQGRFDRGYIRASFLIGADGKVVSLRPMGPSHGPGGPHDGRGPHRDRGPRGEDGPRGDGRQVDATPPPVVPVPTVAPTASAAPTQ